MRDQALRDAKDEQQELEALHRLDEECVHQQRAGNYLKAFDCMERALVLRRHFFGVDSQEVLHACRALAEMCNLLAMSFLQQDNYAVTIDLLKKAELLTQHHHPDERATTLNNLACYYRRLGKLHAAMTSLKRALELEKGLANVRNAADTQLNMCAVLSQLGKHQEALEHAQEALITLQEGFIQGKRTAETATTDGDAKLDRISVMCIAYHNIGVEQEYLKDYAESVASYKKGVGLAEQYLGAEHSIATTIRNSYLAAKRMMATKAKPKPKPCSAGRDQRSPTKLGARHLQSPRNDSLRLPSPLAKEKERRKVSGIPTPRSIIADALSRGPLSALPPLDSQSPPSESKKKQITAPNGNESKSKSVLSPTDPFFSPRFRFEDDSDNSKLSRSRHVGSPAGADSMEERSCAISQGARGRRKSSVKTPHTISATKKFSGTKTILSPQPNTENTSVTTTVPNNHQEADKASDIIPSTNFMTSNTSEPTTQLSTVEPSESGISTSKVSAPKCEGRNYRETSHDRTSHDDSQAARQGSTVGGDEPKQEVEGECEASTSLTQTPDSHDVKGADGAIALTLQPVECYVAEQEVTGLFTRGKAEETKMATALPPGSSGNAKGTQDFKVESDDECRNVDSDSRDIGTYETTKEEELSATGDRSNHELTGSKLTKIVPGPSSSEDASGAVSPELTVEMTAIAHKEIENDISMGELVSSDPINDGGVGISAAEGDVKTIHADPGSPKSGVVVAMQEAMPQAHCEATVHQDEMTAITTEQRQVPTESERGDNTENETNQGDVVNNPYNDPEMNSGDIILAAHESEDLRITSNVDVSANLSSAHDAQDVPFASGSNEGGFYDAHHAQENHFAKLEANEIVSDSPHACHNAEFYETIADNAQSDMMESGGQLDDENDWGGHVEAPELTGMEDACNYDYYSERPGQNDEQPPFIDGLVAQEEHINAQPEGS